MTCDLNLPVEISHREIRSRKSDVEILLIICDLKVGLTTDGQEERQRLQDEATACQLTSNKMFYRHLGPLGFLNLFTAANHSHTLKSQQFNNAFFGGLQVISIF